VRDTDRFEQVREYGDRWKRRAETVEAERDALRRDGEMWRRQAALWRAGIKPGAAAELFLAHLPDDVDLADVEAVRRACAEITAAVLDGHRQLAEASS
jgi:hypothetical protein